MIFLNTFACGRWFIIGKKSSILIKTEPMSMKPDTVLEFDFYTRFANLSYFFFWEIFLSKINLRTPNRKFLLLFSNSLNIAFLLICLLFIHWCRLLKILTRDTLGRITTMGRPISPLGPPPPFEKFFRRGAR